MLGTETLERKPPSRDDDDTTMTTVHRSQVALLGGGDTHRGDRQTRTGSGVCADALLVLLRRLSRPPHGSSHRALAVLRV
jgi:hypothetical protein